MEEPRERDIEIEVIIMIMQPETKPSIPSMKFEKLIIAVINMITGRESANKIICELDAIVVNSMPQRGLTINNIEAVIS